MNAKTKLAVLRSLRQRRSGLNKGFTLVELMIVVAVIGILSAVALPQYLKARANAALGAAVGQQIGLGKECATWVAAQGAFTQPTNCTTAGGSFAQSVTTAADGQCLSSGLQIDKKTVTVTVSSTGALSCSLT